LFLLLSLMSLIIDYRFFKFAIMEIKGILKKEAFENGIKSFHIGNFGDKFLIPAIYKD